MAARIKDGFLREHDLARYERAFRAFMDNLQDTKQTFQEMWSKALTLGNLPVVSRATVLFIGSGTGNSDITILKNLLEKYSDVVAVFVDPSADHCAGLRCLLDKERECLKGLQYSIYEEPIEDFVRRSDVVQEFHFILSIHTFFYLKKPEQIMKELYSRLTKGGLMLHALPSRQSIFTKVREFTIRKVSLHGFHTVEDMMEGLTRQNIPYDSGSFDELLDMTVCFEKQSMEGSLLIDFCTQVADFSSEYPENVEKVLEMIKSASVVGPEDGRVICHLKHGFVLVQA